ncbi:hypothetical protein GFM44_23325 [Rhizobium leguminosarum bv. viciae]|nr:hypothetical protein [Rhizobium leguminosarum bv. viciae]
MKAIQILKLCVVSIALLANANTAGAATLHMVCDTPATGTVNRLRTEIIMEDGQAPIIRLGFDNNVRTKTVVYQQDLTSGPDKIPFTALVVDNTDNDGQPHPVSTFYVDWGHARVSHVFLNLLRDATSQELKGCARVK